MGTFTHEDSGFNSSASSTSLAVTLPNAVAAGDLLVLWVQTAGAGIGHTSVSDSAGNAWTNAYNGQLWYCGSAAAAAGGVTITATVTANAVYQMIADRFTPSGGVVFGGVAASGSAGTIGLNYNTAGCGDLGAVPAGALAWGAFSTSSGSADQAYTPGYQTAVTPPADVIGSQFNGANGTGLSLYVTDCAGEDATLTWYGTGTGAIGSSGSMYFTVTDTTGGGPPPAAMFSHADSVIVQATTNVAVLTATLTQPVKAGDLLVCAVKSPDGSMSSANLSDTAGNTWTIAGGGNFLYLAYVLASKAAPDGLTVTVTTEHISHHGIIIDRFTPADGYTAAFGNFSDNLTLSSFTTGLNYQYGNAPPGTIAGVPAGDLAYMGFFVLEGDPACQYAAGWEAGASGTAAAIGSQVTESNGDGGFSEYVLATDATGTVAMQWYGTGRNYGGWAVQGTFIAVPAGTTTGPAGDFTHQDSGYNSSASSTSLAVTLQNAVSAGDLLLLWLQTAGAGIEHTAVTDSAGNVWTNAYNAQLWYCASSVAAASRPAARPARSA
jgi:hypothetical protein